MRQPDPLVAATISIVLTVGVFALFMHRVIDERQEENADMALSLVVDVCQAISIDSSRGTDPITYNCQDGTPFRVVRKMDVISGLEWLDKNFASKAGHMDKEYFDQAKVKLGVENNVRDTKGPIISPLARQLASCSIAASESSAWKTEERIGRYQVNRSAAESQVAKDNPKIDREAAEAIVGELVEDRATDFSSDYYAKHCI